MHCIFPNPLDSDEKDAQIGINIMADIDKLFGRALELSAAARAEFLQTLSDEQRAAVYRRFRRFFGNPKKAAELGH